MGILGTDYSLRPGHAIFFLLVSSSVILGFSYLNEMYQRIQLQDNMERQIQHIAAERSVIQHKESLLQAQIENRNKEMKRMQNIYTFQTEEQRSNCEKERADLLQNISSRDETIAEVQSEYEILKQQFEHLRSVMDQFEKNQSRLLEKFSTQSTQCMHVIHMLSELCSKEKVNLVQKIAQVTKLNETSVNGKGTQSSTSTVSPDFYKSNKTHSTVLPTSNPPTKATTRDLDHGKQSILKTMQTIQKLVSELNSTSTKDNEDEIIEFEKIENSTEEKNFFKSQTEMGETNDKTSAEKELPKNRPLKEVKSQTQATKLTEKNESLSDSNKVSKSETTTSQTVSKKGNNPQYANISKNETVRLTGQDSRTAERVVVTKELTDKQKENIILALNSTKREGKAQEKTGKNLEDQRKPQRLTLEKEKTPDGEIYKAKGESEYEKEPEYMENGLEMNDQENSDNVLNI